MVASDIRVYMKEMVHIHVFFLTANRGLLTWCVSVEFATNLIKESALSWSQWLQTAGDSPEGPLFQNPIRQNSEQYYLCVCVHLLHS